MQASPAKSGDPLGMASIQPRLLRVTQAAAYLGCSPWHVRRLLWAKEIPFLRLGKRFVVDMRDLDAFIARQKENR